MSERDRVFAIVGARLAGAKAAEELREAGFEGRVVLIGEEADRPYERPPLSKDYLRDELEREKIFVHRALAGMNVNVWDVNEQIQELARRRAPVDVAALEDPAVPLVELATT
jgi:NADPH-dependent 2,4-dienoyl-CoA reductase/sulfur reductase-like enzyme